MRNEFQKGAAEYENKLRSFEETNKKLKRRVYDGEMMEEKLREELASFKKNANHDSDQNLGLRDKIAELNRKIDEDTRRMKALDEELSFITKENTLLRKELEKLKKDKSDSQMALAPSQSEQRLKETIRDLEVKLSKSEMERDKHEFRVQDLNDKVSDLYRELERSSGETKKLNNELRKKTKENEELQSENKEQSKMIQELQQKEISLLSEMQQKLGEINNLRHLVGMQFPNEYYKTMRSLNERETAHPSQAMSPETLNKKEENSPSVENRRMRPQSHYMRSSRDSNDGKNNYLSLRTNRDEENDEETRNRKGLGRSLEREKGEMKSISSMTSMKSLRSPQRVGELLNQEGNLDLENISKRIPDSIRVASKLKESKGNSFQNTGSQSGVPRTPHMSDLWLKLGAEWGWWLAKQRNGLRIRSHSKHRVKLDESTNRKAESSKSLSTCHLVKLAEC